MTRYLLVAAALCSFELRAQTPASAGDVKQNYARLCSGCHGDDARGTQQGPGLAGNVSVRRRSLQSLRTVIRNGIPAAGMPPFELPSETIDGLAALVISLNAVAAENS